MSSSLAESLAQDELPMAGGDEEAGDRSPHCSLSLGRRSLSFSMAAETFSATFSDH